MYDVIIIGAGVSGVAVARELSRYNVKVCVLEKEEDVCCGTSKANSGIVHAGYDAETGSLKAQMNIQGNMIMEDYAEELDVPFVRNGSLVVSIHEEDKETLQKLYEKGIANGVRGLRILNRKELIDMEPNISEAAVAALYAPSGGIICPFTLTIALAENAAANGVEFRFDTEVKAITQAKDGWTVSTDKGEIETRCVVNAAGVYADMFHNMVSDEKIHITARRGEYCLLDKTAGGYVTKTIFQLPEKLGKGVLVAPTTHGNIIVGPTAVDIEDKEGTNTTRVGIEQLIAKSANTVKDVSVRKVITSFAGLRAHEDGHEFIIGEVKGAKGFIDCAGIESPGLTSAPAIGKKIAEIIKEILNPEEKDNFIATRKGIQNPKNLTKEAYAQLIKENPAYGNIICRCEMITEGEILEAIHRPLGARSLDGIKRRTRAGMGRCQAGFCTPKTMDILARELHISQLEITKSGGKSTMIVGYNKMLK